MLIKSIFTFTWSNPCCPSHFLSLLFLCFKSICLSPSIIFSYPPFYPLAPFFTIWDSVLLSVVLLTNTAVIDPLCSSRYLRVWLIFQVWNFWEPRVDISILYAELQTWFEHSFQSSKPNYSHVNGLTALPKMMMGNMCQARNKQTNKEKITT